MSKTLQVGDVVYSRIGNIETEYKVRRVYDDFVDLTIMDCYRNDVQERGRIGAIVTVKSKNIKKRRSSWWLKV